jgi:hypothetical protein
MNAFCPPPPSCNPLSGPQTVVQVFTASGTYTPSPGLVTAVVECIGGGGSGGSVGPPPQAGMALAGGGGGSGGYSRKTLPVALVLGGVVVTVGAGGTGAISGVDTPGQPTTFGALCVANGGGAGDNNNAGTPGTSGLPPGWGDGGKGAPVGIGDVTFPGACGFAGILEFNAGTSPQALPGGMGGQIRGGTQTQNISPGSAIANVPGLPNTGAGGMGSVQNDLATTTPVWSGSDGGSGLCIVTEYCWSTASGAPCPPGGARVSGWWNPGQECW